MGHTRPVVPEDLEGLGPALPSQGPTALGGAGELWPWPAGRLCNKDCGQSLCPSHPPAEGDGHQGPSAWAAAQAEEMPGPLPSSSEGLEVVPLGPGVLGTKAPLLQGDRVGADENTARIFLQLRRLPALKTSVRPHGFAVSGTVPGTLTCWPGSPLLPPRPSPEAPPAPLTLSPGQKPQTGPGGSSGHTGPISAPPSSSGGPFAANPALSSLLVPWALAPPSHRQFGKDLSSNLCSVLHQMCVNEPFRDSGPLSLLSPPTWPTALSPSVPCFSFAFPPLWGGMVSVL